MEQPVQPEALVYLITDPSFIDGSTGPSCIEVKRDYLMYSTSLLNMHSYNVLIPVYDLALYSAML